jgi:hypothetical protein
VDEYIDRASRESDVINELRRLAVAPGLVMSAMVAARPRARWRSGEREERSAEEVKAAERALEGPSSAILSGYLEFAM